MKNYYGAYKQPTTAKIEVILGTRMIARAVDARMAKYADSILGNNSRVMHKWENAFNTKLGIVAELAGIMALGYPHEEWLKADTERDHAGDAWLAVYIKGTRGQTYRQLALKDPDLNRKGIVTLARLQWPERVVDWKQFYETTLPDAWTHWILEGCMWIGLARTYGQVYGGRGGAREYLGVDMDKLWPMYAHPHPRDALAWMKDGRQEVLRWVDAQHKRWAPGAKAS